MISNYDFLNALKVIYKDQCFKDVVKSSVDDLSRIEFLELLVNLIKQTSGKKQLLIGLRNLLTNGMEIDEGYFNRDIIKFESTVVKKLKELKKDLGVVYILESGYSTLATILLENEVELDKIRSFDPVTGNAEVGDIINNPWVISDWLYKSLSSMTLDVGTVTHTWQVWSNKNKRMCSPIKEIPDTFINLHTEKSDYFEDWYNEIPAGRKVVMAGGDYYNSQDHINKYKSREHFVLITPMETVLLNLEIQIGKHKKWLRIGYK
jgi:hypothetical protein